MSESAADLMAAACQAHCKQLVAAHDKTLRALASKALAREAALRTQLGVLRRDLKDASKPDPARAALVELLGGATGCWVSGRDGRVALSVDGTLVSIAVSITTQQTVCELMKSIEATRAARRQAVPA